MGGFLRSVVTAHENDFCFRRQAAYLVGRCNATHFGHDDIQDGHLRSFVPDSLQSHLAVFRLADFPMFLLRQQGTQGAPYKLLVIYHEDCGWYPHQNIGLLLLVRPSASPSAATRINVGMSSVPAADLATNPSAHGLVAFRVPGMSWMVKNTILVLPEIRSISEAVLMPFIPGILM